jgi:AraC family transcriptional regulator of adaptative response / DNA-3-methyladenine glycosylase II
METWCRKTGPGCILPDFHVRKWRAAPAGAADNAAMFLDADQCYRALRTHDARFDGRFFVGVGTTRIYCRPVCTAKTPLARNCRFFPSAAAAEAQGFRPCLRCRPELAPGYAAVDANRRLAQAAAGLIEDGRLEDESLADIARALGVTDRHLRRVFQQEFGVAPVEFAQTQRLLLAKRLLTDTRLPVLEVAMASGFASLRRFNDSLRTRYRMTPGELRKSAVPHAGADRLSFDLAFRPPYDWPAMLAFLERRAVAGVESVEGRRYRRTVGLERAGKRHTGWIEVAPSPRRSALRVTASASLAGVLPMLLARVKTFFDLACRPDEIAAALGPLAARNPGLRLPGAIDGFEVAVRAILGQQVTVKAATTIAGRFARALGDPVQTPHAGLDRFFPQAAAVAATDAAAIAALGIVASRARAIVALARAVHAGGLRLEPCAPVESTVAALERLPGVGPWTAQYIAMRALSWPDAFPHPDVAVLNAMGESSGRRALARAEAWRPWRSYAVLHLWKSLERPAKEKSQ